MGYQAISVFTLLSQVIIKLCGAKRTVVAVNAVRDTSTFCAERSAQWLRLMQCEIHQHKEQGKDQNNKFTIQFQCSIEIQFLVPYVYIIPYWRANVNIIS